MLASKLKKVSLLATKQSISLGALISEFDLEVLYGVEGYGETDVTAIDINRPGLALAGFFDHFDPLRLQVIGQTETSYLEGLTAQERKDRFDLFFRHPIPALIIARGFEPYPECMEKAKKYGRTILRTGLSTSDFLSDVISSLRIALSPRITRHGVLVEVYGEGIFITGESGVGKSETAIELIKRGHRLIADDAVEIRKVASDRLTGNAPPLIRHYIELRGIGVIDVRRLFGMSAVKEQQDIDLMVIFEQWKEGVMYDRLGVEERYTEILDVNVPTLQVPVMPGRNLAVILEVAAMNNKHKRLGFNAALDFTKQIDEHFEKISG